MQNMNKHASPLVVKYGGNALAGAYAADPALLQIAALHRSGQGVVLVHGGGPEIDSWLARLDVPTRRIDGLRVTDAQTLDVTEAALCATVNKRLVRACTALGIRCAGVSGEDAALLTARKQQHPSGDLGFVGAISECDPSLLHTLLDAGYLPIVAPLAISHDHQHALNVNADTAAAAIAGALHASSTVFLTNVAQVRRHPHDPASGIASMTLCEASRFRDSDACTGGMRPKLEAAIAAVEYGSDSAVIAHAGARFEDILSGKAGTRIGRALQPAEARA